MTRAPKDPLLKAIGYARYHRSRLGVCLQDPDVPIDTNHVEHCIRPTALGHRNWLFCWTEVGVEAVGILQSLVSTCRLHGKQTYRTCGSRGLVGRARCVRWWWIIHLHD